MSREGGKGGDAASGWDVAIVGYGPVGMTAASLLARQGHRAVVLERYEGLYNLPRAATFDDETMRTLDALGIADKVLPTVHPQEAYEWRNGKGETLLQHGYNPDGPLSWAQWYMMYQPDLEDALDARAREFDNLEIRMNTRVVGVEQGDDRVTLSLENGEQVEARYVLACDGGNSFVRQALDIDVVDHGFQEPWMVTDFELKRKPENLPMARQVCNPEQPTAIISLGPTHHRVSFMLDSEESFGVESDPQRVWKRVESILTPEDADLIRVATYTFRSRMATRWKVGHVLLLGDAAHQMPPFLGQGMCSGMRDAWNVAFKLDRVLRGLSDDSLLDTYQSEREPHVEQIMLKGIELGRVQTMRDPVKAAERDRQMLAARAADDRPSPMVFPDLVDGLLSTSTGAGELMWQGRVGVEGQKGRFDGFFPSKEFVLILDGRDAAAVEALAGLGERLDGLGVRAVVVRPQGSTPAAGVSDQCEDAEGTYATWFDNHGARAVLVRPDFYVFGTADGDGVSGLVDELEQGLRPVGVAA